MVSFILFFLCNALTTSSFQANSFTLRQPPPAVEFFQQHRNEIKEWGAQVTEDEVFNLEDLDQFTGTDFTHLSDLRLIINSSIDRSKHSTPALPAESPHKAKLLDIGSLYRIIPQVWIFPFPSYSALIFVPRKPHFYPSPFSPSQRLMKGKIYNKAEPIFISPYSSFSIPDDARVAWLIPIRGKLPWDGCTLFHFLDSSETVPLTCEPGSKDEIFWTRDSVAKFWSFLLELRRVGTLGSFGVSFHASKFSKNSSTVVSNVTRPSPSYPMAADSLTESSDSRATLSKVDYIKVYLDASRSFYVRSALDVWSYLLPSTSADDRPQKLRVLKNARLLLLDDGFQPVLVS